jgi:hypothetical protein
MTLKRVPKLLVCVLMASVCGCGSPKMENVDLASAWAKKLAPYGLVALFPPRNMVEPGDVYIVCANPDDSVPKDQKFESVFLLTLPGFHAAMEQFFKSRLVLPASAQAASDTTALDAVEAPAGITVASQWTRLGLASFPQVFETEGSVTSGGAAAPTGFAIFGFGAQHKSLSTYLLSMPAAEWAGLPWVTAQSTARQGIGALTSDQIALIRGTYDDLNHRYGAVCGTVKLVYVVEVYYARHLTLSYGTDKSSAIAAQARLYINANQARYNVQQAASNTAAASAPAAASAASDTQANQTAADLAAAAAGANAAANLGLPGATLNSAYADNDGVSFDYSFAHPVAVGTKLGDLFETTNGTIAIGETSSPVNFKAPMALPPKPLAPTE